MDKGFDMEKTYDHVAWNFLFHMIKRSRFEIK